MDFWILRKIFKKILLFKYSYYLCYFYPRVGYAGGSKKNPSYYSLGDHTETVEVDYDPNETNYEEMLSMFWNNHNPTVKCKRQYMSAIFYHDEEQKNLAEKTMKEVKPDFKAPITTLILPAKEFYDAEE